MENIIEKIRRGKILPTFKVDIRTASQKKTILKQAFKLQKENELLAEVNWPELNRFVILI
ncbi:MAG: hypothetical protein ACOYMB_01545 [Patescibacteria group bacterium]